jgi:hypothetical protein
MSCRYTRRQFILSGIGKVNRPVRNRVPFLPLPPGGLLLDPDEKEDA